MERSDIWQSRATVAKCRWGKTSQGAVRSFVVVSFHPILNDLLSLPERCEFLAVEAFVSEATVEAFNESVLPRTARLDVRRADFDLLQKVADSFADELRTIVAANVFWSATHTD